jgi:hypothetical protein
MMTNLITQQSLESTNTLTYQILPETTRNSLLEPYNPLATIPVCRILPNQTTLTPTRNTGTDDSKLNTTTTDKTAARAFRAHTSQSGRTPSLNRCRSVGLGREDGRAMWQ